MKKTFLFTVGIAASLALQAQNATFNYFTYSGNDARFDKTIDNSCEYYNPIKAGFYPDPSVCRVGDTYYLVNSSFSFYPGVPISVSNDLVNWKSLGHVLDRPSQLPLGNQRVSGGIYAPAITYNKKNKTYYMVTTNVGWGNFFVKTKDPAKGWSEPIRLPHVDGIDPSFFFDDNGKGYLVHNAEPKGGHEYEGQRSIVLFDFDVKGDSTVGPCKEILRGGTHVQKEPIWIEGPHLFKTGNYYYLMCAEGGTGSWHSEVILRSKSPYGPFEEYAGNPILTQRQWLDPARKDFVSSAGHADIVQAKDGTWWAVFLACRPYETVKDYYNTGRDTYLLPVTWKNGWPMILEHGKPISAVGHKAGLHHIDNLYNTGNFSYTDSFDGKSLNGRWMFLRNPSDFYQTGDNGLTMRAKDVNIYQNQSPSAIFVRQQHTDFTAETQITFSPRSEKDFAGMTLFQNEQYNFVCGKTIIDGNTCVVVTRSEKSDVMIASAKLDAQEANQPIRLKIEGHGGTCNFYYATADGGWKTLVCGADASNLSTGKSSGFIGVCIGLYATSSK